MFKNKDRFFYLFFRMLNVVVRPFSLFVYAFLFGDLFSSGVALSYTMGAWLMAPMSLGSYRWALPIEKRTGWDFRKNRVSASTYQIIYYFSIVFFVPVAFVFVSIISRSVLIGVISAAVVVYDFSNHEQSRRILYRGQLNEWAKFLVLRNVALSLTFFMFAQIAVSLFGRDMLAAQLKWVALGVGGLAFLSVIKFVKLLSDNGSFCVNWQYTSLALARVRKYWQLSLCGILSNSHAQIDRLLISIISPQHTWVITVLGYFAQVPAMLYEMMHLARLKSRVLQMNNDEIKSRRKITSKELVMFVVVAIPCAISTWVFLYVKGFVDSFVMVSIYLSFSFLLAITMKKAELVVWAGKDRWAPAKIDMLSGLATLVGGALIGVTGNFALVKMPAVLGLAMKSVLSDKYLKDKVR